MPLGTTTPRPARKRWRRSAERSSTVAGDASKSQRDTDDISPLSVSIPKFHSILVFHLEHKGDGMKKIVFSIIALLATGPAFATCKSDATGRSSPERH